MRTFSSPEGNGGAVYEGDCREVGRDRRNVPVHAIFAVAVPTNSGAERFAFCVLRERQR